MKKTKYVLFLLLLQHQIKAQNFSGWIADSKHPQLKIRYYTGKDKNGYNLLYVQLQSDKHCKLEVTASVCNKDKNDINKWQPVELFKDRPVVRAYKILNSCTNGFWWWYQKYNDKGVAFD